MFSSANPPISTDCQHVLYYEVEADKASVHEFVQMMMSVINRNYANICSPFNSRFPGVGTKKLIEDFLDEIEVNGIAVKQTKPPFHAV